jgi:predicted DNA binding CopG/RHH family protein
MKKTQKTNTVSKTINELRKRAATKAGREAIARAAAIPDDQIDTSDIPEIRTGAIGVRGRFAQRETRQISIRLTVTDLMKANQQAVAKGLPYQTYIKSLLHEALEREARK